MNSDKNKLSKEMRHFSRSEELLERAHKVIPLGTQTFSKSYLNFPRGAYPLYLERGEGARVWDVDGNEYIDFLMALLPVVLGYNDKDVNQAVTEQMQKGMSFSFATEIEIELAEKLVEIIPCAEMVRFGKNGSDATAGALRIARAHTGREKVAVCGYHSWHDWYIAATPFNLGVPKHDKNLIDKFTYNDLNSLEDLLKASPDDFAAIMMEPANAVDPAPGFLEGVRDLAHKYGALFIFDEIVTGWRSALGGAQELYDVTPDLACFGKAMGNGLPIAALVGKREYMMTAEKVFLSSTFGGEALSLAGSLATIDKLIQKGAIAKMHKTANVLQAKINDLIKHKNMADYLTIGGLSWFPRIIWGEAAPENAMLAISLLRQELAEQGIIIGSTLNLSLSHCDPKVESDVIKRWDNALDAIKIAFASEAPEKYMRGDIMRPPYQVR